MVLAVLVYVVIGGMAVAWTDFIQMIVLVVGCPSSPCSPPIWPVATVWCWTWPASAIWFKFLPGPLHRRGDVCFGAAITMMLGSIPQQDVFQRVMSPRTPRPQSRAP